ncbi:MAG: hypothetical protein M3Z35_14105 [Nitrospirota bacterium]|nr:hypothetical protein [Nitrospirota bacterium]
MEVMIPKKGDQDGRIVSDHTLKETDQNSDSYARFHIERQLKGEIHDLLITILWLGAASPAFSAGADDETTPQFLRGDRVLLGTVEEVRSEQARIDTGEVQPRFIPMNVRKEKHLPTLKAGDRVELTINDQNLLVDVHMPGESSHHRIVNGQLAVSMETGHDKAVIRTILGHEEEHVVRPSARVGVPQGYRTHAPTEVSLPLMVRPLSIKKQSPTREGEIARTSYTVVFLV